MNEDLQEPAIPKPMNRATQRLIEAKEKWSERTAEERARLKAEMLAREERAKVKQTLATNMWKCRKALAKSDFAKAQEIADKGGFSVEDARVRSYDKGASLPSIPPPPTAPPPPPGPIDYVNGWPVSAKVEIRGFCRNPRLLIAHLEDGREVCVYTEGRRWRRGEQLMVKLEEATADPRYTWIPGSIT